MIKADNISILKQHFPQIYNDLYQHEKFITDELVQLLPAKNGTNTLNVKKNGSSVFLHSRYDPLREAESVLDQYPEIDKYKHIIFYGVGLGYHIDVFASRYPKKNFYIHEPIPELLFAYLSHQDLKKLPFKSLKNISFGTGEDRMSALLGRVLQKAKDEILIIELPSHKEIFPEAYDQFHRFFQTRVKGSRSSVGTNYAFQKRWTINCMKNFKEVVNTPNILTGHRGIFQDKPVVIAAAGPSLADDIENLRYIKENGLAYIFAVGSAINPLLHNDIHPHAVCAYDPQNKANQKVFQSLFDENIQTIPLVFGSSFAYKIVENYPGPKLHMLTSQDTVADYFLKLPSGEKGEKVLDAATIATVTLQMVCRLGFSRVIFAGQNLSYRGGKRHSEGVTYSREVSDAEIGKGFWVKDVEGNDVLTNEGYNRMRLEMEGYIRSFPGVDFINTTVGGARIEGAAFQPLQTVIAEKLKHRKVDESWHKMERYCYDRNYMRHRMAGMDDSIEKMRSLLVKIEKNLNTIERLCNNRNYKQAGKTYTSLDRIFAEIKANDCFRTFVLPMNRVYYQLLTNEIAGVKAEKDPLKKGEGIINAFGRFLFECKKDIQLIFGVYSEIKATIDQLH